MKNLILWAFLTMAVTANAGQPGMITAENLYIQCISENAEMEGFCTGTIFGALQMGAFITNAQYSYCAPSNLKVIDAKHLFMATMRTRPSVGKFPAIYVILDTMQTSYPCDS